MDGVGVKSTHFKTMPHHLLTNLVALETAGNAGAHWLA